MSPYKLISVSHDAKTVKGQKRGVLTGILYLAPGNISGREFCNNRSSGCTQACLFNAGRAGKFPKINEARIRKSRWFIEDRESFMQQLILDIAKLLTDAKKKGLTPAVRLNGTSDLPWEHIPVGSHAALMEAFPETQFYDYTKSFSRAFRFTKKQMPKNYHLTFSRSEVNGEQAQLLLEAGGNVAVVFASKKLPDEWNGFKVVNGDETDLRFADPQNAVIGLKAKGKARKDTSGFVIHND